MKEVTGDLWIVKADARVITTNGVVKKNGAAVMGRGVALQAAQRFPDLPLLLGHSIKRWGNIPQNFEFGDVTVVTLPVKHHWGERASLSLITSSIRLLTQLTDMMAWKVVVLPRPGCGNGGLTWKTVQPLISFLPDNVHVIDRRRS